MVKMTRVSTIRNLNTTKFTDPVPNYHSVPNYTVMHKKPVIAYRVILR